MKVSLKFKTLIACLLILSLVLSGCGSSFLSATSAESTQSAEQVNTFGELPVSTAVADQNIDTDVSESVTGTSNTPDGTGTVSESTGTNAQTEEQNQADQTLVDPSQADQSQADQSQTEQSQTEQPQAEQSEISSNDVEAKLASMTLEEKVAQLFVITPEALTGVGTVTQAGDTTKAAFEETPVGGIIYFAQNLEDESQVTTMLSDMQTISQNRIGLPVFTGVDEEGGSVARISGNDKFNIPAITDMCEIGASGNTDSAYQIGVQIGTYLSRMGFNLDFAPDADVLSNPENTVVQKRSFGSDPATVSSMALAVASGLNSCGVIACCKHFPGHGATEGDTHEGYAYTNKTLEELESCELIPFADWVNNSAGIIMVGHISLPNVIGDNRPASLSSEIITDLLRNQLGYNGVVITDALNMGAITQQYSSAEAAVATLEAGTDLLLMPENFQEAYQGVLDAVADGTITEVRIDESVRRILNLKYSMN